MSQKDFLKYIKMNPEVIYYPKEAVLKAVEKFETPFFLYSEKRIRENCRKFKGAFDKYFSGKDGHNFWPLYAVKANSNPQVLKIIIDEGFDFDASSETEIWLAEKLGAGGMFTGNYNPASELKMAKDAGLIVNLDDESMLDFFEEGTIEIPETIAFRINPGVGNSTIKSAILAGPDAKYGVPFEKAAEAYARAKSLGVKKFGIHMMTGSNVPIEEQDYFANIVRKLFDVVADIKAKTGIEIELMNIGGGFGVPYRPEQKSLDIERLAQSVREAFDEKCKEHGLKEPRLMAEPGRYIVADAGWLVSKVVVIKDSYKKFVGIDASSNDMPRPSIYGAYHHVTVIPHATGGRSGDENSRHLETVSIVGSICENNDQLAQDRELPVCKRGDIVVIHNCGGHAFSMGHNYNGRLRHAEYLLDLNEEFRQIRKPETAEYLYQNVIWPN